jgi:hypothetical protein
MTLQKIKTSQIVVKGTNITITNIYLTCLQILKHKINVENVLYFLYASKKVQTYNPRIASNLDVHKVVTMFKCLSQCNT